MSNAYSSNLITVTNNQIYDKYVNGVWQNPYQQNKVFALSPSINSYNSYGTYSVKAVLPANTWLSNSSSLISSMSADFADGLGFRALVTNQTFNLNYSSGGIKTWTFKLTLSNGTVLHSRTDIQLDSASFLVFSNTKSSGAASVNKLKKVNYKSFFGYPTAAQPVIADDAFYGQKAAGYMTVIYANADGKFHKPLIVAEGFDPDDILKPEEQFGGNNINTFLGSLEAAAIPSVNNLDNLLEGSYDIIYVDWGHSEDFIERNAMLLEKVIKNVNANRATTTPIVVLGQSMGGVVARYALRDMEIKGINHQTGTFISWDGPQQGANVPIAYQYLSRQARSLYISSAIPAIFSFYDNIIRPAANGFVRTVNLAKSLFGGSPWSTQWLNIRIGDIASGAVNLQDFPSPREMLINYLSTGLTIDNSIHTTWQASLKQMGYPLGFAGQPIQKMAVSNGSECAATESFLPGQVMLDIRGNANTYLIGEAFASVALPTAGFLLNQPSSFLAVLPGGNQFSVRFSCYAQTDGVSAQQYVGTITYTKKLFYLIPITTNWTNWNANSDASILPYDYFPGGEYSLPNLNSSQFQNYGLKYNLQVTEQPSFDFVPVTSELDIGSGNVTLAKTDYLTRYIGAYPPVNPKNSPFSAFITAFSTAINNNEEHIQITQRNGDWLYNQLIGLNTLANCSFMCPGSVSMSGASIICSTTTYTIQNLGSAPNTVITWSATPAGILTITPNGTQATVGVSSAGTATLTANITNANSDCNLVVTKQITIGSPPITITNTPSGSCNGARQTYLVAANPSSGGTNWHWYAGTLNPGSIIYIYTPNASSTFIDVTGGGPLNLSYTDLCGNPQTSGITVYSTCHSGQFIVAPNPATGMVNISTTTATANLQSETASKTVSQNKIYQIKILGQTGNLLKQFSFSSGVATANIDLNNLLNGTYILQIYDNVSWTSQQVVILK